MRLSSEILITEEQIRQRVEAMASAIAADTPEGGRLSVLSLMDGAFMFCADLVRRLPMPVTTGFVQIRSIRRGGRPDTVALPADMPIKDADLLVVEDILDTGLTLQALRSRLDGIGPARVRLAVLLDKPARRQANVVPDYIGFRVPDRWMVGYGLDNDGMYRNLPYITYMQ